MTSLPASLFGLFAVTTITLALGLTNVASHPSASGFSPPQASERVVLAVGAPAIVLM